MFGMKCFREKDGVKIQVTERIAQRLALDGTATFRILDAKTEDCGSYAVVATNSAGECRSDCKVNVISAEMIPTEPKFVIPLKATTGEIGSRADFRVKVKGVPKPELHWLVGLHFQSYLFAFLLRILKKNYQRMCLLKKNSGISVAMKFLLMLI